MLDKKSKIFLEYMNQQPQKKILYYEEPEYPESLGTQDDVFNLIRHLKKEGYLESITSSSSGSNVGVCLTHKGTYWKTFRRMEGMEYVKKSILVPIAVAFFTTLLTTHLLPKLLSLLAGLLQ